MTDGWWADRKSAPPGTGLCFECAPVQNWGVADGGFGTVLDHFGHGLKSRLTMPRNSPFAGVLTDMAIQMLSVACAFGGTTRGYYQRRLTRENSRHT